MSAFVVSKSHIDAMIRAGLTHMPKYNGPLTWYAKDPRNLTVQEMQDNFRQLTHETANQVGQMLIDECVKSVAYRYEDDNVTDLPGPTNAYWLIPYQLGFSCKTPTPVELLKLVNCYAYQSCEHPDWHDSEAYRLCQSLKSFAINSLTGYDEAPWEW